ncbi:MAG: hypothetical protein CVU89_02120 [Firmicutes bacterium HGW-Firmicutes-14]|nr:MAG: hypothetical protein CVU89_02120 [Firmicutes bacterium HGW-Firmicutes-14]
MRDDGKEQLKKVNNLIQKSKTSLQEMEDFDTPKTLQAEFVDIIPLGQFPEDEEGKKYRQVD